MGDSSINNKFKHQQQQGNRLDIRSVSDYLGFPNDSRMEEVKVIVLKSLLGLMGYSLCGYLLFINIDNVKGWILMVLGTVFLSIRIYYFAKRQSQALHRDRQEGRLKDLEIKDKTQRLKEIELEQWERELSVRVTGRTLKERRGEQ